MDKTENKLNKIAVFGPHDRMNYGDFLFPLMLEYALSKYFKSTVKLKKYSLINSDFTSLGAFNSHNFNKLSTDINKNEIDTVIVAGGECLAAKWNNLYSYINPIYDYFYQKDLLKNNRIFRNIPKLLLGGKTEHPFIINNDNYKSKVNIIYHAVGGGTGLSKNFIDTIRKSSLIGLRDELSYKNIFLESNNVLLVPDSAIIISDVYNKKDIKRIIREEYVFFQLSNYKHQNKIEEVTDQLNSILKTGMKIVLCPIGTAKGHEDDIVLKDIYKRLRNNNVTLITRQPTILEIVNLIAYSKLYIGTSLHGVITAMSYGKPYIALNTNQSKLVSFINTWSIEELKLVCDTDNFYNEYERISNNNFEKLIIENTNNLKEKYYQFVELIIEKINQ